MKHSNRRAREFAIQFFYYDNFHSSGTSPEDQLEGFLESLDPLFIPKGKVLHYAKEISLQGKIHYQQLAKLISAKTVYKDIKKINVIDLSILLTATCEMLILKKGPYNIIIDEAIELAKSYSNPKSASFVNKVLDSLKDTQL